MKPTLPAGARENCLQGVYSGL